MTFSYLSGKSPRIKNQLNVCQQLLTQLNQTSIEVSNIHEMVDSSGLPHKLLQILTLGAASGSVPKMHRNIHPNRVYLSLVLFHEDRVLMSNEEILPLIYIDENKINVKSELHWLSKLSYNWSEVSKLKSQMGKVNNEQQSFRMKLLQVLHTLQSYLSGLHGDLGQVYFSPFYFHDHTSVVFSLVKNVSNFKSIVSLSLKWVPLTKALKSLDMDQNGLSVLRSSIRSQMLFQQVSTIGLQRGLYLCYVQAKSSLEDGMQVIVSHTSPSILPYIKMRDNPHVTSDEWRWILQLATKFRPQYIAKQSEFYHISEAS